MNANFPADLNNLLFIGLECKGYEILRKDQPEEP